MPARPRPHPAGVGSSQASHPRPLLVRMRLRQRRGGSPDLLAGVQASEPGRELLSLPQLRDINVRPELVPFPVTDLVEVQYRRWDRYGDIELLLIASKSSAQ